MFHIVKEKLNAQHWVCIFKNNIICMVVSVIWKHVSGGNLHTMVSCGGQKTPSRVGPSLPS